MCIRDSITTWLTPIYTESNRIGPATQKHYLLFKFQVMLFKFQVMLFRTRISAFHKDADGGVQRAGGERKRRLDGAA